MGKIMAKILGQDAVEFGRNNPCLLDLGHDLDQDHGQDFFAGNLVSHVSVYMYVCMGVGEGVCMWGEGRGVYGVREGVCLGWGKGCVWGEGRGVSVVVREGACLWGGGRGTESYVSPVPGT